MEPECFTLYLKPDKDNLPLGMSARKRGGNVVHRLKVFCSDCGYKWRKSLIVTPAKEKFHPEISGFGFDVGPCTLKHCKNVKKRNTCYVKLQGNTVLVTRTPKKFEGADGLKISLYGLRIKSYSKKDEWEFLPSGVFGSLDGPILFEGQKGNVVNAKFSAEVMPL